MKLAIEQESITIPKGTKFEVLGVTPNGEEVVEFGSWHRPDLSGFPFEGHIDMGEDDFEPDCDCVTVDVDYLDASSCPLHGPHSRLAREQREREADDQAEYYRAACGPDVTF